MFKGAFRAMDDVINKNQDVFKELEDDIHSGLEDVTGCHQALWKTFILVLAPWQDNCTQALGKLVQRKVIIASI
eukprot:5983022-Ditylum_brightwellii.AAC.1